MNTQKSGSKVKRRVPLDLHADIFSQQVGTEENDPVLINARQAWIGFSASLEDLHRREEAIRHDPTATEQAKNLAMDTLSNKTFKATASRVTAAFHRMRETEQSITREIERQFTNRQPFPAAQEIRAHMKSLTGKARREFLDKADTDVLSAILSAKPFLSGMSEAEAALVRDSAEKRLFGEHVERRQKIAKARELLEQGGQIYMKAVYELSDSKAAAEDAEKAAAARAAMEV